VEDGPRQISALGGTDLHETRSMMDTKSWKTALIILAVILIANLGGIWLASTL